MSKKRDTVYMQGKIYWAKILGAPRPNYSEDGREWTFEFEPDENGVGLLKEHKLKDRLVDRSDRKGYEDRGEFLRLKRKELDYEGKPNEHIRIVDANNVAWNDKKMIGNGTLADVKLQIVDYGAGKKKGIYPIAIRVLEHVPYESNDFAPLDEDDPRRKAAPSSNAPDFEKDFGLDEDTSDADASPEVEDGGEELDDDFPAE